MAGHVDKIFQGKRLWREENRREGKGREGKEGGEGKGEEVVREGKGGEGSRLRFTLHLLREDFRQGLCSS